MIIKNTNNFYNHIECDKKNYCLIAAVKSFADSHQDEQFYVLNAPLVKGDYEYDDRNNVVGIFSPKRKMTFFDLGCNDFEEYKDEFFDDLSSLSDKNGYKKYVGRYKTWSSVIDENAHSCDEDVEGVLDENEINDAREKRRVRLLISLLIGSINDASETGIEEPQSLLQKIKKKIVLFDGDQTRFIYQDFNQKIVSIQGLAGTGKTELLLHKLAELYAGRENKKIFFTCHNRALANKLKERIPDFFNSIGVAKQIEWGKSLWVDRAWGSEADSNSGLYSYICSFYNIPFFRFSYNVNYETIFTSALDQIKKIPQDRFEYAFDYILVDERQDFPQVFFELCKYIAKDKVYIAGDIYQNIFEPRKKEKVNVDIALSKCYRTDPRTLMFAHGVGMGLFEDRKFNWPDDETWANIGYQKKDVGKYTVLSRYPLVRFDDDFAFDEPSVEIRNNADLNSVISIINEIKDKYKDVEPRDIAVIFLDEQNNIYNYIQQISLTISQKTNWPVNPLIASKRVSDELTVTNSNNAKGLEFTFVICVINKIQNTYKCRNTLYTMLTRSFLKSYLCVSSRENLDAQVAGLEMINKNNVIRTKTPTFEELELIEKDKIEYNKLDALSLPEYLEVVFEEYNINDPKTKNKIKNILKKTNVGFDKETIRNVVSEFS